MSKQNGKWLDDKIQFPRLICELDMAGAITPKVMDALCESMDLNEGNIVELFDRATKKWDEVKALC